MRNKIEQLSLVAIGLVAGTLLALNLPAIAQREAKQPLPIEELRQFSEVFSAIKSAYVEPVEDKKLITEAINGMLSGLDPHSAYLDADGYKELTIGTQGEFGGLGIEVGVEDGFVKVVTPIDDTPAARAGVKAGDYIVKIDGTPARGMSLADAVKRMRGKPHTSIVIELARKGEAKPIVVTLMREIIKVQSVRSKMIEPGYGYVRVSQFQEHTGELLAKQLEALYKGGPLKGLVLDLRNDPGGLLNGAVGVSAAFLPANALVVSTDGRADDSKHKFYATAEDYLRGSRDDYLKSLPPAVKTVPMTVLVNDSTASASEIVAGALQDYKRAIIMGSQTFGKGSVQTIIPLGNNTAIKLTTARYYTPNGRSIQVKGVTPDIVVEDPDAPAPVGRIREADLEKHLINEKDPEVPAAALPADIAPASPAKPNSRAVPARTPRGAVQQPDAVPPAAPAPQRAPIEFGGKDDYVMSQAVNLLKGLDIVQKRQ
jgi:carboxyl-terminal processing protease